MTSSTSKNKNSLFYIILVSLILGGIVRIAYLWVYPVPVRDAYTYCEFIGEWISSGRIPEDAGGGFPPLGLYLFKQTGTILNLDIIKSGTIVNMLAGLLIIATLGTIAHTIIPFSPFVLGVSLVSATHPRLVDYSCQATRENTYLLFTGLSILFFIRYLKSNDRLCLVVVSAVFACAAFLCRHEGFELLILANCVILLYQKKPILKRLKTVLLFSATYVLSFFLISQLIGVPLSYYGSSYTRRYSEIILSGDNR